MTEDKADYPAAAAQIEDPFVLPDPGKVGCQNRIEGKPVALEMLPAHQSAVEQSIMAEGAALRPAVFFILRHDPSTLQLETCDRQNSGPKFLARPIF